MMYSQHEEEKHILEIFAGKPTGTFLDVGAWNGKIFSNTCRLAELGWSGVLVEPSPGPFRDMVQLHGQNPRLRLLNAAVVPNEVAIAPMRFYATDDALSTSSEDFREIWAPVANYRPIYVMPITAYYLAQFCEDQIGAMPVDLVSVDTEGTSFEVAQSLCWAFKIQPRAWCVEYLTRAKSHGDDFKALFKDYRLVYTSTENMLFARD